MGTHKPRSSKGGKRGRKSKIINEANKAITQSYKEENFELAEKISSFSSFIESDKNELGAELLVGILNYKNIIKNDWKLDIKNDIKNNIETSEFISSIKLSDESKSRINNLIINNYNSYYKKIQEGVEK